MKKDCTIKFNSIEEYREIEKTLEELGYENDKEWNEERLSIYTKGLVILDDNEFTILRRLHVIEFSLNYKSLKDFLND